MTLPDLPINELAERHPGLTPEIAAYYLQAARICLDRHHAPPTEFMLKDGTARDIRTVVAWKAADDRCRNAWANEIDATEAGAYAVALAAAELAGGFVAVRRAETGTGADYYIAPADAPAEDIEACIRLEVSGTDRGGASEVAQRLRDKLSQAAAGASNLPAMAGVVGFRAQLVMLQVLETT
jgi:hypothetical protein